MFSRSTWAKQRHEEAASGGRPIGMHGKASDRTETIILRVTPRMKQLAVGLAKKNKLPMSKFLRGLLIQILEDIADKEQQHE